MIFSKLKVFVNRVNTRTQSEMTSSSVSEPREDETCPICMDSLRAYDDHRCLSTPCDHHFHIKCFAPWCDISWMELRLPKCPLCRTPVLETELVSWPKGNPLPKAINARRSIITRLKRYLNRREMAPEVRMALKELEDIFREMVVVNRREEQLRLDEKRLERLSAELKDNPSEERAQAVNKLSEEINQRSKDVKRDWDDITRRLDLLNQ